MLVKLNLFDDVPEGVGFRNEGKYERRQFGRADIPVILECIEEKKLRTMKELGIEPEELVRYDLKIFGYMPDIVNLKLTWQLAKNPEIRDYQWIKPNGEPETISSV